MARGEVGFFATFTEAIPGAANLAVVATKNTVADAAAKFFGDRPIEFDGQVRNAFSRVENIRGDKGLSRADIQARGTAAAMILQWSVIWIERQICENFTQKKIRARLAVQNHRIFTNPADSRLFCESPLENGRAVDKGAETKVANLRLNAFSELRQAFAD